VAETEVQRIAWSRKEEEAEQETGMTVARVARGAIAPRRLGHVAGDAAPAFLESSTEPATAFLHSARAGLPEHRDAASSLPFFEQRVAEVVARPRQTAVAQRLVEPGRPLAVAGHAEAGPGHPRELDAGVVVVPSAGVLVGAGRRREVLRSAITLLEGDRELMARLRVPRGTALLVVPSALLSAALQSEVSAVDPRPEELARLAKAVFTRSFDQGDAPGGIGGPVFSHRLPIAEVHAGPWVDGVAGAPPKVHGARLVPGNAQAVKVGRGEVRAGRRTAGLAGDPQVRELVGGSDRDQRALGSALHRQADLTRRLGRAQQSSQTRIVEGRLAVDGHDAVQRQEPPGGRRASRVDGEHE
jgi:hypothetical protein